MKKLIAALLLAIGVSGCNAPGMAPQLSLEDQAWQYACEYQGCDGVEMPQVVRSDSIFSLNWNLIGTRGFYFPGEHIVYVRKTLDDYDTALVVVVHEMVHAITHMQGLFPAACDNEDNAFRIGDIVARRIGRPDLVRGTDWWKPYRACQNYVRGE